MGDTERHTKDGRIKLHITNRPFGLETYFSGAGDIGAGLSNSPKLLFTIKSNNKSIEKLISYREEIYIQNIFIRPINAPFGASVTIQTIDSVGAIKSSFGGLIPLYDTYLLELKTEGTILFEKTKQIKFIFWNSDDKKNPEEDRPANFKAMAWIRMYRGNTK